ncbi:AEC family transporter [Pseudoclavibacter sp. RFBA6]|uniref:AEC family transporter n=1 Tax=Pseudoclavibacter sp. RFBA6 TaxID=2080573 RepID=UPI000CE8B6AC|nr:AEC family transporter [Pseudoclavibacter sp. RFBA6]PPG37453.1 AEC family transporter [Pseudoclavibacter sp. RFBA6]
MSLLATAIVPIILLLAAGAVIRRWFVTEPAFWRGLEWMSYRVFTPALFISSIAAADLSVVPIGPLALSLAVPIVAAAGLVVSLRRPLRANGPQLTSMVQGTIRINTYIGLIFATALHGVNGAATFALASAIVVPLVNVICVSVLARHGERPATLRRVPIWRALLENPLIQGVAVGLVLNLTETVLPTFLSSTLSLLAAPALVCGTLISGAAMHLSFRRRDVLDVGVTAILKLVALPLGAAGIALSLGVDGPTLTSIVLISAVPTAPSAYVLASRMGGDTRLMASITGIQTILATVSMPAILAAVQMLAP